MAHLHDLSYARAFQLIRMGLARIGAQVKLTAFMRGVVRTNQNGLKVFGDNFAEETIDVTHGVLNQGVVIRSAIPVLPTRNGQYDQQGDVTIQLNNTVQYMSVVQQSAILSRTKIQDATVEILATCGNMPPLPLYKGRVIQSPLEQEGVTEFRTKSILWEIINEPVFLELTDSGDINPGFEILSTGLKSSTPYSPSSVNPNAKITFHHGVTHFDEFGDEASSVTNDGVEKVDIRKITFKPNGGESPRLGKYSLEFTSSEFFKLSQPDGETYIGSINQDFSGGFIEIDSDSWDIVSDPTGVKIEWYCSYTVKGNPITICKNLIEKALARSWGSDYTEDTSLSVNWSRWLQLESLFANVRVFVSETNKDNSVWSYANDKPLRVKDFVQKILDHVGCQLTFDPEGRISVNCTKYLLHDEEVRTYVSENLSKGDTRQPSHEIFGSGPAYNRMLVRYGRNMLNDNYAGQYVFLNGNPTRIQTYEISFDYFKLIRNDRDIAAMNNDLWEVVKYSDARLRMSLKPNWGLAVEPGDKFAVSMTTQPILPNTSAGIGQFWEVYQVTKRIGDVVEVEAKMIPEPILPSRYCESTYCESTYC